MSAGIYIHIPFCSGKCGYCDFYSSPASRRTMEEYAAALIKHIRSSRRAAADTVYFGGGTPSIIGAELLGRILDAVRQTFDLAENPQITFEANPGDICLAPADGGKNMDRALNILHRAGFGRISMGVQSSCGEELKMLGRRHSFSQAEQAFAAARRAGFDDISLDLMYGLPGQAMDTWKKSVNDILSLAPEHISCYALTLSPKAPLYKYIKELPDDDCQLEMYLYMCNEFEKAGYEHYEISNFARPGFRSRHNIKYWLGDDYFGFGPSAHSLDGGVRYAWEDDTAAYVRDEYRMKERTVLTARDRVEEYLMLRLRMGEGIDPDDFSRRFGDFSPYARVLKKYMPYGLINEKNGRYALTERGMFVSNTIICELFAKIGEEK